MDTIVVKMSKANQHKSWALIKEVAEAADLPALIKEMNQLHKVSDRGGACRCAFWLSKNTRYFGFSDKDEKEHAEEHCIKQMMADSVSISHSNIWLMYVDIEPCHGRYNGHNCLSFFSLPYAIEIGQLKIQIPQGKFGLRDSKNNLYYPFYSNGIVLYTFDQTDPGEKSLANFMHDNEDAPAKALQAMGNNQADYFKEKYAIDYFKLGKQPQ